MSLFNRLTPMMKKKAKNDKKCNKKKTGGKKAYMRKNEREDLKRMNK